MPPAFAARHSAASARRRRNPGLGDGIPLGFGMPIVSRGFMCPATTGAEFV
jgi:hypothetical protein